MPVRLWQQVQTVLSWEKQLSDGFCVLGTKVGAGVQIGDDVEVRLCLDSHGKTALAVKAPRSVPISRLPVKISVDASKVTA